MNLNKIFSKITNSLTGRTNRDRWNICRRKGRLYATNGKIILDIPICFNIFGDLSETVFKDRYDTDATRYTDTIAKHQTMPEEKYRLFRGKTIKNSLYRRTEILFTNLDNTNDIILDGRYVDMFDKNAEFYMFYDCHTTKMVVSVYENGVFRGIVMPIQCF